MKKLTYEEVRDYINSIKGYELISDRYIGIKTKLKIKHKVCNTEYEVLFYNFKKGKRCPKCNGTVKHTYEYVKNYIEESGEYTLLTQEYKNAHQKIELVHKKCNNKFVTTFDYFRSGRRCPECSGNRKYTYEEVRDYINSVNGYKLISKVYINNQSKLIVRHLECGTKYEVIFRDFKVGHRCPHCFGTKLHSYEFVKNYIESFKDYKLISKEYKNVNSKLIVRHLECGTKYEIKFIKFKKGGRCPFCFGRQKAKFLGVIGQPIYDYHADKISFCEEVRRAPENFKILQVRCKNSNCRKWFTPTLTEVNNRIGSIEGNKNGEHNFYCSEKCKHTCPIFNQKVWSKDQKPYKDSLERDPYWRKLVFNRDNFECQICGSTENLEAHHIDSIYTNPIMSADLENGITLCEACHEKVHSEPGCRYVDLTRKSLCGVK